MNGFKEFIKRLQMISEEAPEGVESSKILFIYLFFIWCVIGGGNG
jgi:hypothetical protein